MNPTPGGSRCTVEIVMDPEDTGLEPAEVATPDDQAPAESTPAVSDANVPETVDPTQKRIDRLTWEKKQAERERDYYRTQATQQPPKSEPAAPKEQVTRPRLEQFNYDEDAYQTALDKYYDDKSDALVESKLAKREEERTQRELAETWKKRETDFRKKTPDYEDVAHDPDVPITSTMAKLIRESPVGPELAYYLGKNKDIAESISSLDAVNAAREFGRIEAKLSTPVAPPVTPPASKPVSKAPPPPPKLDATESTPRVSTTSPESDSMSDEEWWKAENKRLQRKKAK